MLLFFSLFIFAACSAGYGNKVIGENLTVYFNNEKDLDIAEKLALYWKSNDFMSGEKQDLQIVSEDDYFVLKLIVNDIPNVASISFTERKKLLDFQNELEENVFGKRVEIELTNKKFETIYTLN